MSIFARLPAMPIEPILPLAFNFNSRSPHTAHRCQLPDPLVLRNTHNPRSSLNIWQPTFETAQRPSCPAPIRISEVYLGRILV